MSCCKDNKLLPTLGILACLFVTCCSRSLEGRIKRQVLIAQEQSQCHQNQFYCSTNKHCIPLTWRCDSEVDCNGGEDELNCSPAGESTTTDSQCSSSTFRCPSSGGCIPRNWLCDGEDDCSLGEDEQRQNCDVTATYSPTVPPSPYPTPIRCEDGEVYCEPTQCVLRSQLCDGVTQCANGADEMPSFCEQFTTLPPITIRPTTASTCSYGEFQCASGRCVPLSYRCDGERDCAEGEDEAGCAKSTCKSNQFQCFTGQCIPTSWQCDFEADCNLGEDELNCNATSPMPTSTTQQPLSTSPPIICNEDEYECDPTQCIPWLQLCDGISQCDNAADEVPSMCDTFTTTPASSKQCSIEEFKCASGRCIPYNYHCDGEPDCPSGNDETSCVNNTCSQEQFRCNSGRCIPEAFLCDMDDDCGQEEDEQNCTKTPEGSCRSGYFKCGSTDKCIPEFWVCDGDDDCGQAEDELDCGEIECGEDKFKCVSINRCIAITWRCDKEIDCEGGEDEADCNDISSTTPEPSTTPASSQECSNEEFQCASGPCIPYTFQCDGDRDCPSGDDETSCVNNTCPEGRFRCNSGKCIPERYVCDRDNDCGQEEDEQNCPDVTCNSGSVKCGDGDTCIPDTFLCDGQDDCAQGEDETNCEEIDCPRGRFKCESINRCIVANWRCDNEIDCEGGDDEANCNNTSDSPSSEPPTTLLPSSLATPTPTEECRYGGFQCESGLCIPYAFQCDGDPDCPLSEDEASCVNGTCPRGGFKCNSGKCIPQEYVCDRDNDCGEEEDEQNCPTTTTQSATTTTVNSIPNQASCDPFYVRCGSSIRCIPESWICDGEDDCAEGQDEANCGEIECPDNRFKCVSINRCIDSSWRCDKEVDCVGGDDEANCDYTSPGSPSPDSLTTLPPSPLTCSDDEVYCEPTQCVLRSQLCDGVSQCANGADEVSSFCEQYTTSTIDTRTTTDSSCRFGRFKCSSSGQCIPRSWVCDGENDCKFGEDELQQNCYKTTTHSTSAPTPYPTSFPNQVRCADDEVYCEPTQCVLMSQLCDGRTQCANGADEIPSFCERFAVFPSTPRSPLRCADDEFTCEPTQCVPRSLVCDGIVHCSNGADESQSLCPITRTAPTMLPSTPDTGSSACLPDYIKCYSGKCIPFRWRCDGDNDCSEGEDEVDCTK